MWPPETPLQTYTDPDGPSKEVERQYCEGWVSYLWERSGRKGWAYPFGEDATLEFELKVICGEGRYNVNDDLCARGTHLSINVIAKHNEDHGSQKLCSGLSEDIASHGPAIGMFCVVNHEVIKLL